MTDPSKLTPEEIRERLGLPPGHDGHGTLEVDSGLTEGGLFIRMRHERTGAQIRMDFDPTQTAPGVALLMADLFPSAVQTVIGEIMREFGGHDE